MEISQQNFYNWKHDPVTVEVMNVLQSVRDETLKEMVSPSLIRSDICQQRLMECLGALNVIDQILSLSFEDLQTEGDIENVNVI
jgi:hypothetical protein